MEPTVWLDWMAHHIGEAEITGSVPTAFDRMVFQHTNFGGLGNRMQAGCAATACAALELNGYKSPHSAAAISFVKYGTACELKPGAICVFDFGGGDHHVSFFEKALDSQHGIFLGGNQSHYLKRSTYPLSAIIYKCWPVK